MPTVNEEGKRRQIAHSLMSDPAFSAMPADVQRAVQEFSATGQSSVPFATVLQSARSSNMIGPDSPWWSGLLAMGGAMAGGSLLAGAAGGGAASAAGYGGVVAPGGYGVAGGTTGALGAMGGGASAAGTVGGTSMLSRLSRLGSTANDLGDMFSSGAQSSANGRAQDDFARMNAATANNRARVDVGKFNMDAPVTRAQQVARGDLMAADIPQSQRVGEGRNVSFTGGIGPQMFGPSTTQAGQELTRQSLAALMNGTDKIDPELVTPSRAGAGENIMGGVGTGLNILGVLGRMGR